MLKDTSLGSESGPGVSPDQICLSAESLGIERPDSNVDPSNSINARPRCQLIESWLSEQGRVLDPQPSGMAYDLHPDRGQRVAIVNHYADYVWENFGRTRAQTLIARGAEPTEANALVMQDLISIGPNVRIRSYLRTLEANPRDLELARQVLYGHFYKFASEQGLTGFKPEKNLHLVPFIHVQLPNIPETSLYLNFCEFMATPKEPFDPATASRDKKVAQQLTRKVGDFLERLWQRELEMLEFFGELRPMSPATQAHRLEQCILGLNVDTLDAYLFSCERNLGSALRDQVNYALVGKFLPYLSRVGGPSLAALAAQRENFPAINAPATELVHAWQRHLVFRQNLPATDKGALTAGSAINLHAMIRRYVEWVWQKHGLTHPNLIAAAKGRALDPFSFVYTEIGGQILSTLLTQKPLELYAGFVEHYVHRIPGTPEQIIARREGARSILNRFYIWAKEKGYTEFDPAHPLGAQTWFRPDRPNLPRLEIYDSFCDFLGAQVKERANDPKRGISQGTAINYRRIVYIFLVTQIPEFGQVGTDQGDIQAREKQLRASLKVKIENYVADYKDGPAPPAAVASALRGVFLPWANGLMTGFTKGERPSSSLAGASPTMRHSVNSRRSSPRNQRTDSKPDLIPPSRPIESPLLPVIAKHEVAEPAPLALEKSLPETVAVTLSSPPKADVSISSKRRVPTNDPQLDVFLRARNQAINYFIGYGRGQGLLTLSELAGLRLNSYSERQKCLRLGKGKSLELDVDQAAILNEFRRKLVNCSKLARKLSLAQGGAPLFPSADGGSLLIDEVPGSPQAVSDFRPVLDLGNLIMTSLIRRSDCKFEALVHLEGPGRVLERERRIIFGLKGAPFAIEADFELIRLLNSYEIGVNKIGLRGRSKYFFVGADGGRLTGDGV